MQRKRSQDITQVRKGQTESGATNGKTNTKPYGFDYFKGRPIPIGSAPSEAMTSGNAYKTCVKPTFLIDAQGSPETDWHYKVRGQTPQGKTLIVMAIGPKTLTPKL